MVGTVRAGDGSSPLRPRHRFLKRSKDDSGKSRAQRRHRRDVGWFLGSSLEHSIRNPFSYFSVFNYAQLLVGSIGDVRWKQIVRLLR